MDGIGRTMLCLVFVNAVIGKLGGFAGVATMMQQRWRWARPW
jgi:hypothetical protein